MILIVDCGSLKTPLIEEAVDLEMDFTTVPFWDLSREDFNGKLGVIFSGAPILITEIDPTNYKNHVAYLKEIEIPILGICFGHQLLGLLYGAVPSKQKEDRDWQIIESIEDHSLFDKLPTEFEMMEDHCESISIPTQFKLLAASDACVNEAMCHESKPFFGVQFHPEVSGNQGTQLIQNFIEICVKYSNSNTVN